MNAVHTETLNIQTGDHNSQSYLAYPEGQNSALPGVLVLPEFWGLTKQTKNRAYKLAGEGYTALAVDIYGNGLTPATAKEASAEMQNTLGNIERTSERLHNCLSVLKKLQQADENKLASIGYCLGGGLSLYLARQGTDIKGAVSFHGGLKPQSGLKGDEKLTAKILVLHGSEDSMIPMEQVEAFKEEMNHRGADYKVVCYPSAQHGFTNPQATENGKKFNIPTAYDPQADQASWQEMLKFFKNIFS